MIPKEFWERFKRGNIVVNCQTEDEAQDFVKQCYANGITGESVEYNKTDYQEYESKTCYRCYKYNTLVYANDYHYTYNNYTIIPYSEINKLIKEENKMSDFNYRNKEFNDPVEFANYILKCSEEDKIKAEQTKREKLEAEKAKRQKELDDDYDEYVETCNTAKEKYSKNFNKYIDDYGYDELKPKIVVCFNG